MSLPAFKQTQYDFAAHIRDPEHVAGPEGIEDRRMAVYRELFYNNVEGFVASGFPVLRSLYQDDDWHALIRDYFSRHHALTPHFPELAKEFVDYLQNEMVPRACDPEFIQELAHYEWMETVATLSQDDLDNIEFDATGDLLESAVVISPLTWLLSYEWPVHEISAKNRPSDKSEQPTWIIIYRDAQDEVGFMQINPVTARLIQLLNADDTAITGRQALLQIAAELNHPQPDAIASGGLDTLRQLKKKGIVLGTTL